jgi:hypothetical protein
LHRLSHRANVTLAVLAFIPAVIALVRAAMAGHWGVMWWSIFSGTLPRSAAAKGGIHSLPAEG